MTILYLCDEYPPGRHGGIGTAVQMLAREMVRQGHKVIVAGFYDWGYGGDDNFEDEGVMVFRFRRMLATTLLGNLRNLAVRGLYKILTVTRLFELDIKISLRKYEEFINMLIKKHEVDIVEVPDYIDYLRFCKSFLPFPVLKAPLVVRLHGSVTYFTKEAGKEVPGYIWKTDNGLLQSATAVCSVSRYTAEQTKLYLDYKKEIEVIYNGVDIKGYKGGVEKETGKVVFSGTLIEKKGIYQLIKAWNIVIKKCPYARLWIYGKGPVEKIKAGLSSDGLNSVAFMGHVSRTELLQSLTSANLAVFPSFAETFGLAPIEAMACGTATIFSIRTSGPEIIDNDINGLLVDPANEEEIAFAIIKMLENRDLCNLYASNGIEKVKTNFEIAECAKKLTHYYLEVLKKDK